MSPDSAGLNPMNQNNREGDFENFIPKFIQIVKQPLPRVAS